MIFGVFFKLIDFVISLIPSIDSVHSMGFEIRVGFFDILRIGLYFFGSGTFTLVISSVVTFASINLGWAIIEFVLRKIPGID